MDGKKILYLAGIVLVIIVAMFAFNRFMSDDTSQQATTTDDLPQEDVIAIDNIIVPDQAAGSEVFVERALFKTDGPGGYVVIHRTDEAGAPGDIIAVSDYVSQGVSENFLVVLAEGESVEVGEDLVAMLHSDDGDQMWDATLDVPTRNDDGDVVMTMFTILAEEDIPGFEQKL